jgi:hypothetical protein
MSWKCPACQTELAKDGDFPRLNVIYRCSVCRLEFAFDDRARQLVLAPLPSERIDEQRSFPPEPFGKT